MATGSKPTSRDTVFAGANHSESNQENSKRSLVTDSIATGVVFALVLTVGQRAIGFLRGLLFCRFMTEQELGQWSLVWSFLMMLIPFAVLGLPGCFGRYTEHYRTRGQLGYFVSRIGTVTGVLTLLAAGAMAFFPKSFSQMIFRSPEQVMVIYAMSFCLAAVSISNFLTALMESLRQVRVVTLMRFATGIGFATLGLAFVIWGSNAAVAATVGFGICSLVGAIPAVWVLFRYRDTLQNTGAYLTQTSMWQRLAPFALWMWASNFFNNCFELSDRYMLLYCAPVSADLAQGLVGQYHSGRTIPLLMVSLSVMLAGVLMPYMAAHWEKGKPESAKKQLNWTLKLMAIVYTAGGIVILLLAPFIFETILEGRYDEGLAVLPMTIVYCIWFSLATVGQDYLWVAEKGKWTALIVLIGLVFNLALNALLIPIYGVHGAVTATAIANAILLGGIFGLNQIFGCRTDVGIWVCSLFPLFLLLPVFWAAIAAMLIAVVGWTTTVIFQHEEKAEIGGLIESALKKFGLD